MIKLRRTSAFLSHSGSCAIQNLIFAVDTAVWNLNLKQVFYFLLKPQNAKPFPSRVVSDSTRSRLDPAAQAIAQRASGCQLAAKFENGRNWEELEIQPVWSTRGPYATPLLQAREHCNLLNFNLRLLLCTEIQSEVFGLRSIRLPISNCMAIWLGRWTCGWAGQQRPLLHCSWKLIISELGRRRAPDARPKVAPKLPQRTWGIAQAVNTTWTWKFKLEKILLLHCRQCRGSGSTTWKQLRHSDFSAWLTGSNLIFAVSCYRMGEEGQKAEASH